VIPAQSQCIFSARGKILMRSHAGALGRHLVRKDRDRLPMLAVLTVRPASGEPSQAVAPGAGRVQVTAR